MVTAAERGIIRRDVVKAAVASSFLPIADVFIVHSPEKQTIQLPKPGSIIRNDVGETFKVNTERNANREPILVRYSVTDYELRKPWGNQKSIFVPSRDIERIPKKEVPQRDSTPFWDGTKKRYNPTGGIKFVFIPGLNTNSRTDNTFAPIKRKLKQTFQGVDERDFFDCTYNIAAATDTLGLHYTAEDTLRDPEKSFASINTLIYRWKEQNPLDKLWLFGHSNGGWLAYKLALEHPDCVLGAFTYHGVLAGAGNKLIPSALEKAGIPFFAGEAGAYHIRRGIDPDETARVAETIDILSGRGQHFTGYTSTSDPYVEARFSQANTREHEFPFQRPHFQAALPSYTEWNLSQQPPQTSPDGFPLPDFSSPQDTSSATLATMREEVGNHGSALVYPPYLDDMARVIQYIAPPQLTVPSYYAEMERLRKNIPDAFLHNMLLLREKVIDTFSIRDLEVRGKRRFTITIDGTDKTRERQDVVSWLKATGLTQEQIQSLTVFYQTRYARSFKESFLGRKEPATYTGKGFMMVYDKATDGVAIDITDKTNGESELFRFLKTFHIETIDDFGNVDYRK